MLAPWLANGVTDPDDDPIDFACKRKTWLSYYCLLLFVFEVPKFRLYLLMPASSSMTILRLPLLKLLFSIER